MRRHSYRNILILIVITALVLTAAQVYFTIQNYQVNKQRFIQDVRQALDASIENYFANRAKSSIYILAQTDSDTLAKGQRTLGFTSRIQNVDSILRLSTESGLASTFTKIWSQTGESPDSAFIDSVMEASNRCTDTNLQLSGDSTRVMEFTKLTQKVMISISEDLLDIGALYSEVEKALKNNELDIAFKLRQQVGGRKTSIGTVEDKTYLTTESTSTYLGDLHSIAIDFENATMIILRNGISELVLSVLLIGLVVGTLIHLYRTINEQKQLAEIKDDLISNITHEFKTPIATIFSALEGVTSFNETNDPEKTRRYLVLSNDQLHKLNNMVEKMLETATIDQGKLSLNPEETEVVAWTEEIVGRFQLVEKNKSITFERTLSSHLCVIDRFHLENTLTNLIDNAIKYGGDLIFIHLLHEGTSTIWEVRDNGGDIPKAQRDKVFDKLYRIPTGNKHDVKGFGIGLYYARNIAELHGGQLTLEVANNQTVFRLRI